MNGRGLELDRIDRAAKRGRSVPLVRQLDVHLKLRIIRCIETDLRLSLSPLEGRSNDVVILLVFVNQILQLLNV